MSRLILLFVTVPLVELFVLLRIGNAIGLWPTVALILATGVLGASLARSQGLATWGRFQEALAAGRLPGRELVEGLLILVAGAVLLTPGVLTDAAGFLILTPPVRRWIVAGLERRFRGRLDRTTIRGSEAPGRAPDDVIDAEFEVRERPEHETEPG